MPHPANIAIAQDAFFNQCACHEDSLAADAALVGFVPLAIREMGIAKELLAAGEHGAAAQHLNRAQWALDHQAAPKRELQPCPICGNIYDHRYPCVG